MAIVQHSPALTVARVAKLALGDLFLCHLDGQPTAAILAEDPSSNNERVILLLGPDLPGGAKQPCIIPRRDCSAISFGRNYALRLPVMAKDWHESSSALADTACILFADSGDVYMQARTAPDASTICYVDLSTGKIFVTGSGAFGHFGIPPGIKAFATRWEFLTTENEPRSIIAYPRPAS